MSIRDRKNAFEQAGTPSENALLTFTGVEGWDVYNCSVPFPWQGKQYIYGRVERRNEWARSKACLFEQAGPDRYALVAGSPVYQLEDPYISRIGGELVLGGTHVRMRAGKIDTYYGYFYRGTDLSDLVYFTTGPDRMKDIRLVRLRDGIGVFSRPNGEIGFTVISGLEELTADVIAGAPIIKGIFAAGEWGACNQCYLLESGKIGIIGHQSYAETDNDGVEQRVYTNIAFVLDPATSRVLDHKIVATRSSFPDAPAKKEFLKDCAFPSGIVMRPDGKADLYSGLGDTAEGRVVIDYPFGEFGAIADGI